MFSITIYTLFPFSVGLLMLVIGYVKLWQVRMRTQLQTVALYPIWLLGIIGFLTGIAASIVQMMHVYDILATEPGIDASYLAKHMRNAFQPTLIGVLVSILSLISWGVVKAVKNKKVGELKES